MKKNKMDEEAEQMANEEDLAYGGEGWGNDGQNSGCGLNEDDDMDEDRCMDRSEYLSCSLEMCDEKPTVFERRVASPRM